MQRHPFLLFCCCASVLVAIVIASAAFAHAHVHSPSDISCFLCNEFVRRIVDEGVPPHLACRQHNRSDVFDGCSMLLSHQHHHQHNQSFVEAALELRRQTIKQQSRSNNRRSSINSKKDICFGTALCDFHRQKEQTTKSGVATSIASWDIKVTPLNLMRGAGAASSAVRITVIDNGNNDNNNTNHTKFNSSFTSLFSYNEPFQYFWTDKTVHTGIFPVTPGQVTNINLGGYVTLPVRIPKPSDGMRMMIIGDPCFWGEYVNCRFWRKWNIRERLLQLINSLAAIKKESSSSSSSSSSPLDAIVYLGDVFYDPYGTLSPHFFTNLTVEASSSILSIVALGNHDFYDFGNPAYSFLGYNNLGYGPVQYYGIDTVAAAASSGGSSSPFNFSNVDSHHNTSTLPIVDVSNTVSWSQIGNVGYIVTSSMEYTLSDITPYLQRACQDFAETKPDFLFILNHWSSCDSGCRPGMTARELRDFVAEEGAGIGANKSSFCKELGSQNRVKSFEGHTHNNAIVEKNVAFRFGGFGMNASAADTGGRGANFGIPLIDSHGGKLEVSYFPIAADWEENGDAQWSALMECVEQRGGLHECTHLAETWLSQSLA